MPARFSLPIYALRQLKERLIPSKNALTFTLTIEYDESVLAIHEGHHCVWSHKIPFAAMEWVEAVIAWLRHRHKILIGEPHAERMLMDIGSIVWLNPELVMKVKGRNMVTGIPDTLEVNSSEIQKQIPGLALLVDRLKWFTGQSQYGHPQLPRIPDAYLPALQYTPVVITGKYGWLKGLPDYLEEALSIKFVSADD